MPVEVDNFKPIRKYRAKDLNEKQIAFCEAYMAEGIAGKAARIAGYSNPNRSANDLLQCRRIQEYIAKRQKQFVKVPITFEAKAAMLNNVAETAITYNIDDENKTFRDKSLLNHGFTAIDMLNKMQGHYAPEQSQSVNVNVNTTREKLKEIEKQYDEY